MSPLHVSQRQESYLQCSADRLTPVGSTQLPEDVVKMRLDRGSGQTKVHCESFGRMALGDASENLHLSGR